MRLTQEQVSRRHRLDEKFRASCAGLGISLTTARYEAIELWLDKNPPQQLPLQ